MVLNSNQVHLVGKDFYFFFFLPTAFFFYFTNKKIGCKYEPSLLSSLTYSLILSEKTKKKKPRNNEDNEKHRSLLDFSPLTSQNTLFAEK